MKFLRTRFAANLVAYSIASMWFLPAIFLLWMAHASPQQLGVLPQRTMGDGYPLMGPEDQRAYYEASLDVDDARRNHSPTLAAKRVRLNELTRIYVNWCAPLAVLVVNQQGWAQCSLKPKYVRR